MDERRRERDGERLVELEILDRKEVQDGRAEQQGGAADLQGRPRAVQHPGAVERVGPDEGEDEAEGVARPHDFQHVHVAAEIFGVGVEKRKAADRPAHQRDAGQPCTAGIYRIRRRVGKIGHDCR